MALGSHLPFCTRLGAAHWGFWERQVGPSAGSTLQLTWCVVSSQQMLVVIVGVQGQGTTLGQLTGHRLL